MVEGDFEAPLKSLVPSRELFDLASAIFRDLWDQRVKSSGTQKKHMAAEIFQIDRKVEQLVERMLSAENDTIVRVYENQIGKLEFEARSQRKDRIALTFKALSELLDDKEELAHRTELPREAIEFKELGCPTMLLA